MGKKDVIYCVILLAMAFIFTAVYSQAVDSRDRRITTIQRDLDGTNADLDAARDTTAELARLNVASLQYGRLIGERLDSAIGRAATIKNDAGKLRAILDGLDTIHNLLALQSGLGVEPHPDDL